MEHDAARPGEPSTADAAPELPSSPTRRDRPSLRPNLGTHVVPRAVLTAVVAGAGLFFASGSSASVAHQADGHRPAARAADHAVADASGRPTESAAATPTHAASTSTKASAEPSTDTVDHGDISALAANGIPTVALNAYRVAAARMAHVDPGCGIHWYLVAAIGRVESDHGRFGGADLHADGTSVPRTIGPALDGKKWDYIPAPANGLALAGDSKYAHALGPMQFIPSTWNAYGADATGDGKADIFNINDAALATANYLCAAGGDLHAEAGQKRAVLTYNHNTEYLAEVLGLAAKYAEDVKVSGKPKGKTTGELPKVKHGGKIPPANPGGPAGGSSTPPKHRPAPSHSTRPTSSAPKPSCTPAPSKTRTKTPSPSGSKSGSGSSSPKPSPSKSATSSHSTRTSSPSAPSTPTCRATR